MEVLAELVPAVGFGDVCRNGYGRSSDLVGQSIGFGSRQQFSQVVTFDDEVHRLLSDR